MTGHNFNLNGDTIQLGNNAGASLNRTAGIAYGGVWKRWFPAAAITNNSGSFFGLFPIGTSAAYRPLGITSTSNPVTPGYVLATHTDALTITFVTYTDNEAATIQDISDMYSALGTSGLAGGAYTLAVSFTGFANIGATTDLKLETHTGGAMGSLGTSAATTGTVVNPNVIRTLLTATQLSNIWIIGSKNKINTPLRQFYYSRKSGLWDDVTAGNSTWSLTPGGAGASCNCVPVANSYCVINPGQTVTADVTTSEDYIDVDATGVLNDISTITLTVNKALNLFGNGNLVNSGTWNLGGTLTLTSTSACTATGAVTVSGATTIPSGGVYTQSAGTLNLSGDVAIQGTLALGASTCNLNGSGNTLSGAGNISGVSGSSLIIPNNKTIAGGSTLTFGSSLNSLSPAISGATTITNNGSVKIFGDLTGNNASSIWTNAANSTLELTGNLLTTGALHSTAAGNTVIYSGSGNQTIKSPTGSYYNLTVSNTGTKTLAANASCTNLLSILNSAILNDSIYTLSGAAALSMSGVSEFKLQRGSSGTYPELTGIYTLSGGTVTINQTSGVATLTNASYNNLEFTGSSYDISGISNINNNLYLQGSSSIINNGLLTIVDSLIYASSGTSTLNQGITAGTILLSSGTLNDGGATYQSYGK